MERAYNGSDGGNILYGYALSTEGEKEDAWGTKGCCEDTRITFRE